MQNVPAAYHTSALCTPDDSDAENGVGSEFTTDGASHLWTRQQVFTLVYCRQYGKLFNTVNTKVKENLLSVWIH